MAARYDPRTHAYEDQTRFSGMVYMLMLLVAVAFGGFVWQLYSTPEIPRITAPAAPYRHAPAAQEALDAAEDAPPAAALAEAAPAPGEENAVDEPPPVGGPPQLAPAPSFVSDGPYVAQLAALQSEAGADVAWRRLASRAPGLFAPARLDVERADLGQRGVYYRVRAGYFADRANASRFCERIRQMGQDCIPTAR